MKEKDYTAKQMKQIVQEMQQKVLLIFDRIAFGRAVRYDMGWEDSRYLLTATFVAKAKMMIL